MAERYVPLCKTIMNQEMITAAEDAMRNDRLILGESVSKFEEEFARFCRVRHAISTNSGTSALFLSLLAFGMKNGQEAITTDMSFIATANVVLHAFGKPVLCDVNGHGNIDQNKIAGLRNGKTKAIIPVHLHGHPANMDEINELAQRRDIVVIEDACQAHGAEYRGKMVGALSEVGCFSFNPMKNMTVGGDGGMVTTNDEKIAKIVRELVDTGRKTPYDCAHTSIGYTARLNTINAAIGRVQLKYLKEWNEDRTYLAEQYRKQLEGIDNIEMPPSEKGKIPAYNKFVIRVDRREELKEYLWNMGISSDAHFSIPIHLQPIYRKMFGYREGQYPGAEKYAKTTLSLPLYPLMDLRDLDYVCEHVRRFFEH